MVSETVKADGSGASLFQHLPPNQRLAIMFDACTLASHEDYVRFEPNKDSGIVNGWHYLVQGVYTGIFHSDPKQLRRFITELHRVTYPGHTLSTAKPGVLRTPADGISTCYTLKKNENCLISAGGIRFKNQFLKQAYAEMHKPDLPTFMLQNYPHASPLGTMADSLLAVDADTCVSLMEHPPQSTHDLQHRLRNIPLSLQPSVTALFNQIPAAWVYHRDAVFNWFSIQGSGLCSRPPDETEAVMYSCFYSYQKTQSQMRALPPPGEFVPLMFGQWCKRVVNSLEHIQTRTELYQVIGLRSCELMCLRPFRDGNCRVAIMIIQGLLMTFGQRPIHLKTRYIFGLSPCEVAELIEAASAEDIPPLPAGLSANFTNLSLR